MFKAIEKKSVPEQVVAYILDSISNNTLREDDKLPSERLLCEELRVSRSSLREGLIILELMNVIEKRNDGTYIKIENGNIIKEAIDLSFAVTPINYFELIEVRNLLEAESAVLAAKNATISDIKKLDCLCQEMKKHIANVKEYAAVSTEFHIAVAKATKNDILYQIFETIRYIMYDYQKDNMMTKDEILRSYNEHIELLEAFKAKDMQRADEIMRRHLEYTQNLYENKN